MLLSDRASTLRAPRLRLIANGQIVVGATEAEVISTNYYGADRFSTSIALGFDPWAEAAFWASEPHILLEVQFSVDNGASYTSLIKGSVDSVNIDPTIGLVHLEGRDLTASLIEARIQETFANRTSSEIATLLAVRHGLSAYVTPTAAPVGRYYQNEHDRVTLGQFANVTTEWDLLVFLARQESFDVFVSGDALFFQPVAQTTATAVSLRPEDVIDLKLERSLILARDIEVVVNSWNSRQNNASTQRARASGQQSSRQSHVTPQRFMLVRPNLTSDDALKLAQRTLAELTRHERVIRLTMPGDLVLSPRSVISIEGTGTEFDQPYYVDVIERRLRFNGGLTQYIQARNTSPRTEATMASDVDIP